MRKVVLAATAVCVTLALAGCGNNKRGYARSGLDEFAVARRAPLVVPPDFALAPPKPGAPRPQEADSSTQALQAMFGGPAPRSAGENGVLNEAGSARAAAPGIRTDVGTGGTPTVVDKGATTQQIIAAPAGSGQDAQVSTPQ
ncbi:DUF3035 domain-containing protein [Sphingomonas sp. ID0503]|uniref:DUF3035 domain-containing protein n=1 Tax=Sphingomonas sp. ID0503 TaxID=3399691 RepID=UPI003AFB7ADA